MALIINNRIWELSEKLYIHCYETSGFVDFLKSNGIDLPDNFYGNFEAYSFMSTEQNNFAQFMQRVPSYRYLAILEKVIFDEKIKNTQRDNWNYYGTYIKKWYPELLDEVKKSNFKLDISQNKIELLEEEISGVQNSLDFLQYDFNDPFLDYIKKEINESYREGLYLAVMILTRKLIECIIHRVFEIVFRERDENGKYIQQNHQLWYDTTNGRILNLDKLIDNLKANSSAFYDFKDLVEDLCSLIKVFKDEVNKMVHRDYKIPKLEDVEKKDIPGLCNKLRRVYIRFCNP